MKTQKRKAAGKRVYWRTVFALTAGIIVLNGMAFIRPFCDWYKKTIYSVISDCLGMLLGWFPLAIGELIMYAGALSIVFGAVLFVLLLPLRRRPGYRRFAAGYGKGVLLAALVMLMLYSLNWSIPFRSSILQVKGAVERGYTLAEVAAVRDHIVTMLNACAEAAARDAEGKILYDRERMSEAVFRAMRDQAADYPLLSGYYPPMKAALCSDFLEWMGIGGYTYPYTMEITFNDYCHDLYYPALLAHESAHHQGYYQENEANFISFLSCITSEDPLIRYAGYYSIYYYLEGAYQQTAVELLGKEGARKDLQGRPQISELARRDMRDSVAASEEKYESKKHPAEQLAQTAADAADVGWSVQGDILRENSYDGVTKMVLEYYSFEFGWEE